MSWSVRSFIPTNGLPSDDKIGKLFQIFLKLVQKLCGHGVRARMVAVFALRKTAPRTAAQR
jgi:hypothetical protein